MFGLRSLAAALVTSCLFFQPACAHSSERNPLRYITTVDNATIYTPGQRIHAASSFELWFDLHGAQQKQTVRLKLSPNHDVISDDATVTYLAPDGTVRRQERLVREEYKVYKGDTLIQHFPGKEWTNVGWARIVVHRDGAEPLFEGAFRLDGDHHHVQTRTHFMQTRVAQDPLPEKKSGDYMICFRDSDISSTPDLDDEKRTHAELVKRGDELASCSADGLSFNADLDHPIYNGMSVVPQMVPQQDSYWGSKYTRALFNRQIDGTTSGNSAGVNLASTIGNTDGCPTTRKVALVGIATDCTYTAVFNSTASARSNIISVVNSASVQYEDSFNITLGLQNLTIADASCPTAPPVNTPWNIGCSSNVTILDRLNLFSAWRGGDVGPKDDTNAYWTLLSTCSTGEAVGLAWLGQACVATSAVANTSSTNSETVSGANVVVRTSTEWQVFAHESGHTFGAVHDCTSTTCSDGTTVQNQQCCPLSADTCDAGGGFIMNPSTSATVQRFSACSIGNVCAAIGRNSVKTTCLTNNKAVTLISTAQCGNGIVEAGEDCDCGGTQGCGTNSCCNPTTCKFTSGSLCDPSNEECCTSTCQLASSGSVCRASTGTCDPAETCSGTSAVCPANVNSPDGTDCGNSLKCASGQCTSRDLQCKTLTGTSTLGNDTYSCPTSFDSCQITCQSPSSGTVCYAYTQNFLDGSPCSSYGTCENGSCKRPSQLTQVKDWVSDHKLPLIICGSVVGGIILLTLAWRCCCTRKRGPSKREMEKQQRLNKQAYEFEMANMRMQAAPGAYRTERWA